MIKLSVVTAALAAALVCVSAQATPTIINGGFETADLTGWGGSASSDGFGYNPFGTTYGSGMQGTHWMWMAGYEIGRTLTQTVTGLTSGNTYSIKFIVASEFTEADDLNLSVDGGANVMFTASPISSAFWDNWQEMSFDFVASGSSALLQFSTIGLNAGGYDVGLDNVRVEEVSSVPEPISALLVGMALLGAGAASSRRRP